MAFYYRLTLHFQNRHGHSCWQAALFVAGGPLNVYVVVHMMMYLFNVEYGIHLDIGNSKNYLGINITYIHRVYRRTGNY